MLKAKNSQKHIAVFAFPFASHPVSLLCLTRRLSESAPDVMFSFFNSAKSNASLFLTDDEFDNIKPYNVDTAVPDGYVYKGVPSKPVECFLKQTPGNFERALEMAVAETGMDICCLITDALLWFAAEMAEAKRIKWISFWSPSPRSMLAHLETDNLRKKFGVSGPEDRIVELFPGFTLRAMDLPGGIITGSLDETDSIMMYRTAQKLPHADVVCMNSFEEVDLVTVDTLKSRIPKLFCVGPLILAFLQLPQSDEHGCLEWLAAHERTSVAYISFGNTSTVPPLELTALAEALEESKIPFLWSLTGNAEEELPKGFLKRTRAYGKIVPWAPQLKVLAHSSVGVHVTHCGWNSVTESIIGGVPIIGRSSFADQGLNRRTLEIVWGIGFEVEGGKFTKAGITKALKAVLLTEEGKKMREKIAVLKELAFQAVEPRGSSTANFKALIDVITNT